jgi:hypothetical protein
MRKALFRWLNQLLILALPFFVPAVALAQEESSSDVGTAVVMAIIGFVLLIVIAVVIIAAVGLGVIGIGYGVSRGDEG